MCQVQVHRKKVAVLQVHFGFPHINLLQSGKTVQEGFERVKILYDGIPKADVLSIQGEGHPVEFSGGVRRGRGFRQGTAG